MGLAVLDAIAAVYNPAKTACYAEDITASGTLNAPILSMQYEDTPDGCGAATLNLSQYYEQPYDQGIWTAYNIVEISTGDNVTTAATAAVGTGGTLNVPVDSAWPFDPTRGEDHQLVYLKNGTTRSYRCALQGIGYSNAPTIVHTASDSTNGATSITLTIPAATAGNQMFVMLSCASSVAVTYPAGFAYINHGANGASFLGLVSKSAAGGETSLVFTFASSTAASVEYQEIHGASGILSAVNTAQSGPSFMAPQLASTQIGALAYTVFTSVSGANPSTPYGWNLVGAPAPTSNQLAAFWTYCTDTNPYNGQLGWANGSTTAGVTATVIWVTSSTPAPYIIIGTPADGSNLPAYPAGTIVGRRRYAGRIVKRVRENSKTPLMTLTLAGLQNDLGNCIGDFLIALSAAQDVGALCYQAIANFAASHFPFFALSQTNFPTTGATYSGNNTNITVDAFLQYALDAITTGDQWNLRVGHDLTPRLVKIFDYATLSYTYNVTLPQSTAASPLWGFEPVKVTVSDQDTSNAYNAIMVTGDSTATGQSTSAIVTDATAITALGFQIDGPAQSNLACKTNQQCAIAAQGLLNANVLPVSVQQGTVPTNWQLPLTTSPGLIQRGDVVRGVANVTVTNFPGDAPSIAGLVQTAQSTYDWDALDSQQDVTFQAVIPDFNAQAKEIANATSQSLTNNTQPGVGNGQYQIETSGALFTYAGLVVTAPFYHAVFAQNTLPVAIASQTITLTASTVNYVWLTPSGTYVVQTGHSTPLSGDIPYAKFQCNATQIIGSQLLAATGLIVPGVNLVVDSQMTSGVVYDLGSGTGSSKGAGDWTLDYTGTLTTQYLGKGTSSTGANPIIIHDASHNYGRQSKTPIVVPAGTEVWLSGYCSSTVALVGGGTPQWQLVDATTNAVYLTAPYTGIQGGRSVCAAAWTPTTQTTVIVDYTAASANPVGGILVFAEPKVEFASQPSAYSPGPQVDTTISSSGNAQASNLSAVPDFVLTYSYSASNNNLTYWAGAGGISGAAIPITLPDGSVIATPAIGTSSSPITYNAGSSGVTVNALIYWSLSQGAWVTTLQNTAITAAQIGTAYADGTSVIIASLSQSPLPGATGTSGGGSVRGGPRTK